MAEDIPQDTAGVLADIQNFINVTDGSEAAHGLTEAQVGALRSKRTDTVAKIDAQAVADTAKRTASAERRAAYKDLVDKYRELRQVVQNHPETTDVMRAVLGLATGEGGGDIADALEFAPLLLCEPSGVHHHLIRFFMQGEASNSTRKPPGILGAKIFLKIDGAASTDLKEYGLIVMDTKSPYIYEHNAANAGKTAHYITAWTTKDEDDSPQSEVFSLVIT
jgi:hypothetical protein